LYVRNTLTGKLSIVRYSRDSSEDVCAVKGPAPVLAAWARGHGRSF